MGRVLADEEWERIVIGAAARASLPALGYASAYALAIVAGRATRVEGSEVSLVWPAAAVAVLWGIHARSQPPRGAAAHWTLLATLTFVVNLATGASFDLAVWFVGVNIAMAAVTTVVLGYGEREIALQDPADLGRLCIAITAGTLVAATLATAYFAVQGQPRLGETFALFSARNGATALAGVAVVLRLRAAQWRLPAWSWPRLIEIAACVAVTVWVFGRVFWFNPGLPIAFGIMLPALWISLRFSTTTSTLFLAAAGISIAWATLLDRGALEGVPPQEQALLAQSMVGCLAFVVLTLSLFRDSRNDLIGRLSHLALHDPLTGLANRALLIDRIEAALARPRGLRGTVGVLYIDLDGFKQVNDAWGHREGDLLLNEMARRISAMTDPADIVARIGGDEFVVACFTIANQGHLHAVAERIRACIAVPYGEIADAPFDRITASIGTARSGRSSTARSLLVEADRAMYDAKRSGRNRTLPSSYVLRGA